MVAILVLLTVIAFLTIDYFVQRAEARKAVTADASANVVEAALAPAFQRARLEQIPRGVFAHRNHQWSALEPTGLLKIGLDGFVSLLFKKIDRVELPRIGDTVRKGDVVARFVQGNRKLELRALIEGTVKDVNASLATNPAALLLEPFEGGWVYKVAPAQLDSSFVTSAVLGETAVAWMRSEIAKLRDVLAHAISAPALVGVTAQDGGVPVEEVGRLLSDEAWNRVVQTFLA
ncbi:MAG TPA: hypothetical protein VI895_01635 [Bdellovibrionota bacterium]|nr:hypothetical protein [Bdellovibrionota bacterium]